jgi:hypothetical protein
VMDKVDPESKCEIRSVLSEEPVAIIGTVESLGQLLESTSCGNRDIGAWDASTHKIFEV